MAIEFESNQDKKQQKILQAEENAIAEKEGRKPKQIRVKKSKKSAIQKLSTFLLTLSILGLIYAITFSFSGIIFFISLAFLWLIWIATVVLLTVFTLGIIWLSKGWQTFNSGFIAFNNSLSNFMIDVVNFLHNTFAYFATGFAVAMLGYLIMKIVQYKKHKDEKGSKAQLVWTIVMVVFFACFIIFDIIAMNNKIFG